MYSYSIETAITTTIPEFNEDTQVQLSNDAHDSTVDARYASIYLILLKRNHTRSDHEDFHVESTWTDMERASSVASSNFSLRSQTPESLSAQFDALEDLDLNAKDTGSEDERLAID